MLSSTKNCHGRRIKTEFTIISVNITFILTKRTNYVTYTNEKKRRAWGDWIKTGLGKWDKKKQKYSVRTISRILFSYY